MSKAKGSVMRFFAIPFVLVLCAASFQCKGKENPSTVPSTQPIDLKGDPNVQQTAAATSAGTPTTQFSRAEILEQARLREIARDVLENAVLPNYDTTALQRWLEFDEKWAADLRSKLHENKPTSFQPQAIFPTTREIEGQAFWEGLAGGSGIVLGPYLSSGADRVLSETKRRQLVSGEEAHPLPEVNIGDAKKVLEDFNRLKTSESRLRGLLNGAMKEGTRLAVIQLSRPEQKRDQLFDSIVKARTDYLSFDVISPNLARAEQLIYLSDLREPIWGHDEKVLADAAKVIEKVCDQGLLLESDEMVRDQFMLVQKALKKMAGAQNSRNSKCCKRCPTLWRRRNERGGPMAGRMKLVKIAAIFAVCVFAIASWCHADAAAEITQSSTMYKGYFGESLVNDFYLAAGRKDILGKWHPTDTGPDRIFELPDGRIEVHEVGHTPSGQESENYGPN